MKLVFMSNVLLREGVDFSYTENWLEINQVRENDVLTVVDFENQEMKSYIPHIKQGEQEPKNINGTLKSPSFFWEEKKVMGMMPFTTSDFGLPREFNNQEE